MPREINPEIAKLMGEGLTYEAAYKRVRRNVQKPEIVQSQKVVGQETGQETGQTPVQNVQTRTVGNVQFQRRMKDETADDFNARWEAWSAEHGTDPSGKKPGWEKTRKPGTVWFTGQTIETEDVNWEGRLVCVKGEQFVISDGSSVAIWRRVPVDKDAKEPEGGYVTRHTEMPPAPPLTLLTPDGRFEGVGRGVPVDAKGERKSDGPKMVLVAMAMSEDGDVVCKMVSEEDWSARLTYRCQHGLAGFSCKPCLQEEKAA